MNTTPALQRRIGPLDWLMLGLALFSVALLAYEAWGEVEARVRVWMLRADYLICGLFAAEFLWRWRADGWRRGYLGRNWYELLGMIPVQHPAVRAFRLIRIVRIVVVLSRFGMAADRAFGDGFTYRLVRRFQSRLVDAIKGPITVAVLGEVSGVLGQAHFTANIARALRENENELEAMIAEKLRGDPQAGRLRHLPFYDDIVRAVTRATFRVLMQVLSDRRTDELIADVLRENLEQIKASIDMPRPAASGLSPTVSASHRTSSDR